VRIAADGEGLIAGNQPCLLSIAETDGKARALNPEVSWCILPSKIRMLIIRCNQRVCNRCSLSIGQPYSESFVYTAADTASQSVRRILACSDLWIPHGSESLDQQDPQQAGKPLT
jgi:hypothetical protein